MIVAVAAIAAMLVGVVMLIACGFRAGEKTEDRRALESRVPEASSRHRGQGRESGPSSGARRSDPTSPPAFGWALSAALVECWRGVTNG
jgi:hypothetical protein